LKSPARTVNDEEELWPLATGFEEEEDERGGGGGATAAH
jgi:hypothetical protein